MMATLVDRRDVMNILVGQLTDELIIGGLGNQSYDLYNAGDRPSNFYMWGAMGIAPSVGLGVALGAPRSRVIALEGDGGMLMNLGTLATIGSVAPANLGVIIFDNAAYDLTGGQPTATASGVDLAGVARACGIELTEQVESCADFDSALRRLMAEKRTWCLVVKVGPTSKDRVKPLVALRERFMQLEPFIEAARAFDEVGR